MRRIFTVAMATLLLVGTPGVALAQSNAGASASTGGGSGGRYRFSWPPDRRRARGLMFAGSFGVDGCTDHICDGMDPLVYFRMEGLYRVLKYLAVGLHFGMHFADPDGQGRDHAYDVFIGPEAWGILPLGPLDIWAGMALGWMRMAEDGEECWAGVCWSGSGWTDGFGLAWGAGGLFYVIPRLGLGADFWLYKGIFDKYCLSGDGGHSCSDVDNDDVGITWSVGFTAVYFLGL